MNMKQNQILSQIFIKNLDPTNTFNPGIGKTSKLKNTGNKPFDNYVSYDKF